MKRMGLEIYAGKTFFRSTPPANKSHLWISVTNPEGTPEQVVIVNLTTHRNGCDTTVLLNSQDHRFIKHETVVRYVDAQFAQVVAVQNAIKAGISSFHDDCSDDLLEKLKQGLLVSQFTSQRIKKYCKNCFYS